MVDTKLVDMTEDTAPADDDLFYMHDSTAIADRKVQWKYLAHLGSGQVSVTGGASGQTLVAATWTKVDQFTAELSGTGMTAAHASDKVQNIDVGVFLAIAQVSFTVSASIVLDLAIYWNGAAVQQSKLTTAAAGTQTVSLVALVNASSALKDFELWVRDAGATADFVVSEGQLAVVRVA